MALEAVIAARAIVGVLAWRALGGAGSGNFGHGGRPGEVGGSSTEGGSWKSVKDMKGRKTHIRYVEDPSEYSKSIVTRVMGSEQALKDYTEAVLAPIPGDFVVEFRTYGIGDDASVTMSALGKIGDQDVEMTRAFDLIDGNLQVNHIGFILPNGVQGLGIGKDVMTAQLDAYQKLGVTKVEATASMDVGGYAWAKYGFQLSDRETNIFESKMDSAIHSLEIGGVGAKHVHEVERIMAQAHDREGNLDPKVVWKLSDLTDKVTYFGKETTLGKALLIRMHWDGVLDMKDKASVTRARSYSTHVY
jgi:hypothetical protein